MRCSEAFAYIAQRAPHKASERQRDYVHLYDYIELERLRSLYRASEGLPRESEPDEYEAEPPPSEKIRALGAGNHRRWLDIISGVDRPD